jgi:hypothetical protein
MGKYDTKQTRSLNRFNERKMAYEERVRAARAQSEEYSSHEANDSTSPSSKPEGELN